MRGQRHSNEVKGERHHSTGHIVEEKHGRGRRHSVEVVEEKRGHGRRVKEDKDFSKGAQTFRRKRVVMFLDQLEMKRQSLKEQLETPELQSINQIIVGELKAVEQLINEYIYYFELNRIEDKTDKQEDVDNVE